MSCQLSVVSCQLSVVSRGLLLLVLALLASVASAQTTRPNIVWLILDDASPNLGAYGDAQAITPNMDKLAREGARFTRAFATTPVCAPSRSALVTGMYATTTGAHHMRSKLINPPETFMSLLRKAGYYVAWPGKGDVNFDTADPKAPIYLALPNGSFDSRDEWLKSAPPKQPFLFTLNIGVMHEGQIRGDAATHAKNTARLKPEQRHDPAKMKVPAYWPDAPEVRNDMARYYDLMTAADYQVGDVLAWLEKNGLADNTIVCLFGEHGRGMPREKRWPYDSGIHVPLVVRWPGKVQPGTTREDLVSLIDMAPTMLTLAGASVPARMQGQVILGDSKAKEREFVFSTRDRMDEAEDRIRSVRDKRYHYLRNFHPELPYAQRIAYNEESPTMRAWRKLNEEGKLTGAPALFFAVTKPKEELYDTEADPDEIHNLAKDPKYRQVLVKMRGALNKWIKDTKDMGAIPERELIKRGVVRDMLTEYEERKKPGYKPGRY
jgi:uncharacterized sulfatase